ncbi:MAG: protoporphyrinogen oxidase [Frankiaceae bacterium]
MAVVGAGVTGLAVAYELAGKADVTVVEATGEVGGKLRTSAVAGVDVDEGAESFLARTPEAAALAAELGCRLVAPATTAAAVWVGGRLRPLPAGTFLGVPTRVIPVLPSRLLSPLGLARAAADLVLPATRLPADPTVGGYVAARLGHQVVDRLVDPLLGGVYAGRADELSLPATVPQLAEAARGRSLLLGARAQRTPPAAADAPVFQTVDAGLGAFARALARAGGARILHNHPVTGLDRTQQGWRLRTGTGRGAGGGPGGRAAQLALDADAVVLALPGAPAARLLRPIAPRAAAALGAIPYASVAVATFVYQDVVLPPGSGFLVPPSEGRLLKGATFASSKWAHMARPGLSVVRCSAGRSGEAQSLQRPDRELLGVLAAELAEATGVLAAPTAARLTRWGGALPQYRPGHAGVVGAVRDSLPDGVAVAGAALDGVGIPACIRSGRRAARETMAAWLKATSRHVS